MEFYINLNNNSIVICCYYLIIKDIMIYYFLCGHIMLPFNLPKSIITTLYV